MLDLLMKYNTHVGNCTGLDSVHIFVFRFAVRWCRNAIGAVLISQRYL